MMNTLHSLTVKLILFLLATFFSYAVKATLLFSDVSYTADSVTFTVDGDMSGYRRPQYYFMDFSLEYGGDLWTTNHEGFEAHTWSRPVFDDKSFETPGFTGRHLNELPYSWSRYPTSLSDASVSNATITLTMKTPRLNVDAKAATINFIWGLGQNIESQTRLQTVSVPEINLAGTPLALSLITTIVLIGRERKKQQTPIFT